MAQVVTVPVARCPTGDLAATVVQLLQFSGKPAIAHRSLLIEIGLPFLGHTRLLLRDQIIYRLGIGQQHGGFKSLFRKDTSA